MRVFFNRTYDFVFLACCFWLVACSSGAGSGTSKDLPSGWEGALRVTNLVQVVCPESLNFANERATFQPGTGSLGVDYEEGHFRCEQDVEGFFKSHGVALDILVQPIDMHPAAVAGCDCGYNITFVVEPLAPGNVQATLYRRWDDWNTPNDPFQIASELVTVQ